MNSGIKIRLLLLPLLVYLAVFTINYYNFSGKPYLNCCGKDTPFSFVVSDDQTLFSQGRENSSPTGNENNLPVFDLRKHPNIFLNPDRFNELAFRKTIITLIDFTKETIKNPTVSEIIFPFDYFW